MMRSGRSGNVPRQNQPESQQDDEEAVRRVVAARLPRHISVALNVRWRGKPAATTFFIILLGD
jgi:hypothetical protein